MTTFVSHVFAELQRVDVTRRHSLGLLPENVRKRKPLPGNTRSSEFSARGCVGRSERMKSCLKA